MSKKEPLEIGPTISKILFQSQVDDGATVDDNTLVLPDLPKEDRDRVLGMYMGQVSELEGVLQILLWRLLQTDMSTSFSVFTLLGFRQLDDLLPALSKIALREKDQKALTSLCRRLNTFAAKRNKIVHGRWNPQFSVGTKGGKPTVEGTKWFRSFAPTDPAVRSQIGQDQKTTAKYQFSIDGIYQAAKDTNTLRKSFEDFMKSLTYLPDPPHIRKYPEPPKPTPDTNQ